MGFREMRSRYGHNPWACLTLPKPKPLPAGEPVDVVVRVFDQDQQRTSALAPTRHGKV